MDRREFLIRSGRATAAAVAAGAVGMAFHNREIAGEQVVVAGRPEFGVAADVQFPVVVAATNEDHEQALRASLDAVGGIKRFVN